MEPEAEEDSDSYDEFAAPPEETVAGEVSAPAPVSAPAAPEAKEGTTAEAKEVESVSDTVPATSVELSNNVVAEQDQKQPAKVDDEEPPGPPPSPPGPPNSSQPSEITIPPGPPDSSQPPPEITIPPGPPDSSQPAPDVIISPGPAPAPKSSQFAVDLAVLPGPMPNLTQQTLDLTALPASSVAMGQSQTLTGFDLPVKAPPAVGVRYTSEVLPKSAFGLSKAAAVVTALGTSALSPPLTAGTDSIFAKSAPAVTSKSSSLVPVVGSTAKAMPEGPPPLLPPAPCWLPMTTGLVCPPHPFSVPAAPLGFPLPGCGAAPLVTDPCSAQLGYFSPVLPLVPPLQGAPFAMTELAAAAVPAAPAAAEPAVAATAAPEPAACSEEAVKSQLGTPEKWETIAKTGWKRVHTDKGFQYFYNKKTKTTSWTCPPEIADQIRALDDARGRPATLRATGGAADAADGAPGGPTTLGVTSTLQAGIDDASKGAEGEQGSVQTESVPKEAARPTKAERAQRREEQVKQEQRVAKERDSLKNFRQLLMEKGVKAFDKFDKWLPKLIHDPRFTAVAAKERKALFEALAKRMDSEKRKQAAEAKQSGRAAFNEILAKSKELGLLDKRTSAQAQREVERRFSDDARWNALPQKERNALIIEAAEEEINKKRLEKGAAQQEFKALVLDRYRGREGRLPSFHSAKQQLQQDKRWDLISSPVERERLFGEALRELQTAKRKRNQQQQRDEAEADTARKQRRRDAAEEDLINLLTERVKAPYKFHWDEVHSMLRDNSRFKDIDLSEDQQEKVWEEYKQQSTSARRQAFVELLTHSGVEVIGPDMSFELVFKIVLRSPAGKAFAVVPKDVLREAWEEWQEHAHRQAVEACQMWLRSCEHFRGLEGMPPEGPRFNALLERLSQDVRFRRLAARPSEQHRLVAERLTELRAAMRGSDSHGDEDIGEQSD